MTDDERAELRRLWPLTADLCTDEENERSDDLAEKLGQEGKVIEIVDGRVIIRPYVEGEIEAEATMNDVERLRREQLK